MLIQKVSDAEENINEAIADYLNSHDDLLLVPFVRESYGVHLYGSKRAMISNERDKLIVKVGGGSCPLRCLLITTPMWSSINMEGSHWRPRRR